MKMIRFSILVLFSLGLILPGKILAIAPLPTGYPSGNQGTNQYYSVDFDKENEAAVVGKLTYTNNSTSEIKNIVMEIPGTSVRIISAIQEQVGQERYCIQYDYTKNYSPQEVERPCLEYSQRAGSYSYAALTVDSNNLRQGSESAQLNLELKKPIASYQTGSIILNYKTKGFVTEAWNAFQYNFETIKSAYDIDQVRVAINVADDLYIKETAQGETNYQEDLSFAPLTAEFSASSKVADVSSRIIYAPGVVKETTSLDPNENFKVSGKYYENQFLGQLPTIAGVGAVFVLIIVILIVIIRSERKK